MLLSLCYICPPIAVLFTGRPFGMMLNMFIMLSGWGNAVKHALACYTDRRVLQYTGKITDAINNPGWTQGNNQGSSEDEPRLIDDRHIGANGTRFKRK